MRTVRDILQTKGNDVYTIEKEASVYDALRLMDQLNIGSLVVVDKGDLAGMLTERDYASKIILKGKQSKTTPIKDVMTKKLVVAKRKTTIDECMGLMTSKRVRHLPVVKKNKLVGLISIGDVVKEIIDEQNVVIGQLESYIYG